jgi:release factor glutamine methyltransferase
MKPVTLSAALADARRRFADAGIDDPGRDARVLLGGILDLDAMAFLTDPDRVLDVAECERIEDAVRRRLAREPVYRILGKRPFFGLVLSLSPETLEPRPDTETLVERLIPIAERVVAERGDCRILDLGTGTGAICLALLDMVPGASGIGADLSAGALETARRNAGINGLAGRFQTVESDWFESIDGTFDIIVSNPPYIVSDVMRSLDAEVLLHDPHLALDGGRDGLDAYRSIAAQSSNYLREDGAVAFEIGYDQKQAVTNIMTAHGYRLVDSAEDLGGNDRALVFQRDRIVRKGGQI